MCFAGRLRAPRAPAKGEKRRGAAFPGAAREEFFRGVEPEARRNTLALRRDSHDCRAGRSAVQLRAATDVIHSAKRCTPSRSDVFGR